MLKWDTQTTPIATNKLHERKNSSPCSTAIKVGIELWPIIKKKLYILTVDMNCLKQKKVLPGPDRSYKELPRVANRCPEMTGAARLKQELPGATKR